MRLVLVIFVCLCVRAVGSISNTVVSTRLDSSRHVVVGTLFIGSEQQPSQCIVSFTNASSTVFPSWIITQSQSWSLINSTIVSEYVYTDRQGQVQLPLVGSVGETCQLSITSVNRFSIVFGFYNTSLLYFDDIPESIKAHLTYHGYLSTVNAYPNFIPISATTDDGNVSNFVLSMDAWQHQLVSSALCGAWTTTASVQDVRFLIECNNNTLYIPGGPNILSVSLLQLGVYMHNITTTTSTTNAVCIYSNNMYEIDNWRRTSSLVVLCLFMAFWLGATHNMYDKIMLSVQAKDTAKAYAAEHSPTPVEIVWYEVCVLEWVLNTGLLLFIVSINTWAAFQRSRTLYSIAAIDLIGTRGTEYYGYFYGYGMTLYLSATVIVLMMYGNLVYRSLTPSKYNVWFSWNNAWIGRQAAYVRLILFVVVVASVSALTEAFWIYVFAKPLGAAFTIGTSVLVLMYVSSSTRINHKLFEYYKRWTTEDDALLIYLASSYDILLLTAINNVVPFDFGGALTFEFNTECTAMITLMMLYAMGRNMAYMWSITSNVTLLLLHGILLCFVISYSILFGVGALYTTSGALRNLPHVAFVCAATRSIQTTGFTFVYTLYHVGNRGNSKARGHMD